MSVLLSVIIRYVSMLNLKLYKYDVTSYVKKSVKKTSNRLTNITCRYLCKKSYQLIHAHTHTHTHTHACIPDISRNMIILIFLAWSWIHQCFRVRAMVEKIHSPYCSFNTFYMQVFFRGRTCCHLVNLNVIVSFKDVPILNLPLPWGCRRH